MYAIALLFHPKIVATWSDLSQWHRNTIWNDNTSSHKRIQNDMPYSSNTNGKNIKNEHHHSYGITQTKRYTREGKRNDCSEKEPDAKTTWNTTAGVCGNTTTIVARRRWLVLSLFLRQLVVYRIGQRPTKSGIPNIGMSM